MADNNTPIIIKKIKKGGGGHHGGAWKVAYADFVTAMMAFFLLLWLLSSTSKEQRDGIADYFTPTTGLKDSKGIGFEGGLTPSEKGVSKSSLTQPGLVVGQVPQGPVPREPTKKLDETVRDNSSGQPVEAPDAKPDEPFDKMETSGEKGQLDGEENEKFKQLESEVLNAVEQSPELSQIKNDIIITQTPEGMKIDIADNQNRPMFVPGSAVLTDAGKAVLRTIGDIVSKTDNKISMAGHTDSSAFGSADGYSSWELSSDRANAARRFVSHSGVDPERIAKVTGMADRDLLVPAEPNSPRNRRISLTLLRGTHVKSIKATPTARGLLTAPNINAPQLDAPLPATEPKKSGAEPQSGHK